jgi:3-hydroxyacyl-[acyl-carrier-protein] dehydratase
MLASGKEILELLPQRPPMVMVDSLASCDARTVVTRLTVREENVFMEKEGFSSSGLMECMAQTAAARTGWLLKNNPGGENKKAPIGVIGSIKNFKLHFQPVDGSILTTTIDVEYEIMQATIVKAKVETEGRLAAEAELQIFLTETEG